MRLQSLLIVAGLVAAPVGAVAGPDATKAPSAPDTSEPRTETFQWSMSTSRARLGVMALGLTPELRKHFGVPEDRGVMVGRVEPNSAAAAAGLLVGDILVEAKGKPIDSAGDVIEALATAKKDELVGLSVFRDGKPLVLSAKMQNDPLPPMRMPRFREMSNWPDWPGWGDWMDSWFERGPNKRPPRKLAPDSPAS